MKTFRNLSDGQKIDALICFTDIVGFAPLAESMDEDELAQLLKDLARKAKSLTHSRHDHQGFWLSARGLSDTDQLLLQCKEAYPASNRVVVGGGLEAVRRHQ